MSLIEEISELLSSISVFKPGVGVPLKDITLFKTSYCMNE
jgi:hypothetical protein